MKGILEVDLERQIMADPAIAHWNGKEVGPNPGGVEAVSVCPVSVRTLEHRKEASRSESQPQVCKGIWQVTYDSQI